MLLNVWRGLYVYTVELPPGVKRIQAELDLFRDSRPIVTCTLVPDTSAARALPCDQGRGDIEKECPQ